MISTFSIAVFPVDDSAVDDCFHAHVVVRRQFLCCRNEALQEYFQ